MAIDLLQSKIRKLKNPSVVGFSLDAALVPPELKEGRTLCEAYALFCGELLAALKGTVPAVRFGMGSFALAGAEGMALLSRLMERARALEYYVLLDLPELLSPENARLAAGQFLAEEAAWQCDGLVLAAWLGSDVWKPFLPVCEKKNTDIFVLVRSGNKSAPELQDLLTGGRLAHQALADHISRYTQSYVGKYGYSRLGAVAAASSGDICRNLRGKYKQMFLLLDGYDYPNANAKNCAQAFDKLGHGAAACAASGITGAWREAGACGYCEAALQAALRMKKNLNNYFTIL